MPFGLRKVRERLRRIPHSLADGKGPRVQRRGLFIVFAERDEGLHKIPQLLRLRARLINPLLLADLHFKDLQTRADHCNGRFEFMSGIGDKLLLLLGRAHDRIDGAARKQHHKKIDQRDADGI